jgi:hypothetical protein
VLRFRRDHLHIGFEPDRLSLVRLGNAFTGLFAFRVIDSLNVLFDENVNEVDRLRVLKQELAKKRWQDTEAHIVLSDRLARYFIAKCPDGTRSIEEVRLAAHLRFEDVYREASDAWEIRLDMSPFANRRLGCALRKNFVAELVNACAGFGIRISSLVPFAVAEYNHWQAFLSRKGGWFGVLGRHGFWIGRRSRINWESANQYALNDRFDETFHRVLAQESLRASSSDVPDVSSTVWMAGDLTNDFNRERLLSPSLRLLGAVHWPSKSAEWSAAHRVALSSVWPA